MTDNFTHSNLSDVINAKMESDDTQKRSFAEVLKSLIDLDIKKHPKKGDRKLTQEKIAEIAGVSRPVVNRWLNSGLMPNADELLALAKEFHCSTDFLLGLTKMRSPQPHLQITQKTTGLTPEAVNTLYFINLVHKASEMDPYLRKKATDAIIMLDLILENIQMLFDNTVIDNSGQLSLDFQVVSHPEALEENILVILYRWFDYLNNNYKEKPSVFINGSRLSTEESKKVLVAKCQNELTAAMDKLIQMERGEA